MKKAFTKSGLKSIVVILTTFLFMSALSAQEKPGNKPDKRIIVGGNLGLQLGTITFIDISPLIGYKFKENIVAGIGGTYQYFRDKRNSNYLIETDVYGGRLFARYYFNTNNFLDNLFLHTEYEILNLEAIIVNSYGYLETGRINVPAFFIGAGIRQPIGDHSNFTLVLLWDLIEDLYSPYINPVLRAGVDFGI